MAGQASQRCLKIQMHKIPQNWSAKVCQTWSKIDQLQKKQFLDICWSNWQPHAAISERVQCYASITRPRWLAGVVKSDAGVMPRCLKRRMWKRCWLENRGYLIYDWENWGYLWLANNKVVGHHLLEQPKFLARIWVKIVDFSAANIWFAQDMQ